MEFIYGENILVNKAGEKINEQDLKLLIGKDHCQWIVRTYILSNNAGVRGTKYCIFDECFRMVREYISENIVNIYDDEVLITSETQLNLSGEVQVLPVTDNMSITNYINKWIMC